MNKLLIQFSSLITLILLDTKKNVPAGQAQQRRPLAGSSWLALSSIIFRSWDGGFRRCVQVGGGPAGSLRFGEFWIRSALITSVYRLLHASYLVADSRLVGFQFRPKVGATLDCAFSSAPLERKSYIDALG